MFDPTPAPVTRELLQTREIVCRGYKRSDGLLEIEGELRDVTVESTDLPFHQVPAGGAIHDMRLVMTVDKDLVIQQVAAAMDAAANPYCFGAVASYPDLSGIRIGPGFRKRVIEAVGRAKGCTHLTELVERMANAAMQTQFSVNRAENTRRVAAGGSKVPATKPWVIGTCYGYREDGEAVRIVWPNGFQTK